MFILFIYLEVTSVIWLTRTFQHGLEFIMPRYIRIIHSRPWWNVHR